MSRLWRSVMGLVAAGLLLSMFGLLPSAAQEAATPAPPAQSTEAPKTEAPRPEAAEAPEAEEPAEEELRPDERVSADNNLSFPVDI